MKMIPLFLLLAMAVIFYFTLHSPSGWIAYVHAFAEAAMVGALADWFAVTALFRHPLGIPIPHTAIIPRRKDAIGDNMARFVAENFLTPDAVRGKLAAVSLAERIADWLSGERASQKVADLSLRSITWMVNATREERVRSFIRRVGEHQFESISLAPLAGKTLELLTVNNRHQDLLTQTLRFLIVLLHDNRERIRSNVQHESPWWLPGFVDDKIVKQMLDRIEALLLEMSLDPEHELRRKFNNQMASLAQELQHNREYRELGDQIKEDLLANEALYDYLLEVWRDLGSSLGAQIGDDTSAVRQSLTRFYQSLGRDLADDAQMQELVDTWLSDAIVAIVEQNGAEIASLISDTVASWDSETTSRRVELAIGRDLQFIRVNGTLVGGLVGVVLHFLVNRLL